MFIRTAPLGRFIDPRPDLRRLREFRPRVGVCFKNVGLEIRRKVYLLQTLDSFESV